MKQLNPKSDKGNSLSLEAVLLRELKKACAPKAIQGEVRRHSLPILCYVIPTGVRPEIGFSKYFRKVHRNVKKTFMQKNVCLHQLSCDAHQNFLITQRQVHTLDQVSRNRR